MKVKSKPVSQGSPAKRRFTFLVPRDTGEKGRLEGWIRCPDGLFLSDPRLGNLSVSEGDGYRRQSTPNSNFTVLLD